MFDELKSSGINLAKRLRRAAIVQLVFGCVSIFFSLSIVSNLLSVACASIALRILKSDPAAAFAIGKRNSWIWGLDIAILVCASVELVGAAVVGDFRVVPGGDSGALL